MSIGALTTRLVSAAVSTTQRFNDFKVVEIAEDGTDSTIYYIKPINGTAIKNSNGTLTLEAHRVTGSGDEHLSTGSIRLFEGSTPVTTGNGYPSPSDGYTGTLDSGDINDSVVITLKDGAGGAALDTITLVDVTDGGVVGYIEPSGPLAWSRQINAGGS